MKSNYDVIIVGAGPGGASLAYQLAKRGIDTLLLEKEKLPRYKCCAGGITGKTARLLDFDVSQLAEDVVYEIGFGLGAAHYQRKYPQPLMYTVSRETFDYFLAEKAKEQGAVLLDAHGVTGVEMKAGGVVVTAGNEVFGSRLVVGADGVHSVVARKLGIAGNRQYLAAMAWELVVGRRQLDSWRSRARADWGAVPGGYGWVFPKRDHLCVGVGCPANKARNLARHLQEFLNLLGISEYSVRRSCVSLIPTCKEGSYFFGDRALLLGDAAGFADPLTGEGIHHAVKSSRLAALAIEDFLREGQPGLAGYQGIVEKEIVAELSSALTASRVLSCSAHLLLPLLGQSEEAWKAIAGLMSGELNYGIIERRIGGLEGILGSLSQPGW